MKIKIDLHELWNQVQRVSDDVVDIGLKIETEWVPPEVQKLRERLKTTGIHIKLNDITTTGGLLSYRGQHVLLYIPDHDMHIEDTLREPILGKKFHLAECRTIRHMRAINRYARYVATTNTSGLFRIVGINQYQKKIEGEAKLHVCKNCLRQLNYKGAQHSLGQINIADFNIEEFFEQYSSVFINPRPVSKITTDMTGYTSDCPELSRRVREAGGWKCSHCGVTLKDHKHLLHVHHTNGVKNDNSLENLVILCASCHRLMPLHENNPVPLDDLRLLNEIRFSQSILDEMTWLNVFDFADPALKYGLMKAKSDHWPIPEVFKRLRNGEILDLAWPDLRIGVSLTAKSYKYENWDIWDFNEFSSNILGI